MVFEFLKLCMDDTLSCGIFFPFIFTIIELFMSDLGLCHTVPFCAHGDVAVCIYLSVQLSVYPDGRFYKAGG